MGKSPASCFRIITCGGGEGGTDEPTAKEAGDLNSYENKRGWSFRKKSGRHRGLNTSTVSETPAATRTRETLESALLKSPSPDNNIVSEKPFAVQSISDKSQLPVTEETAQVPVPEDVKPTGDKTELPVPVESRGAETEVEVDETEKKNASQVNTKGEDGGDATVIVKDVTSKLDAQEPEADDVTVIRKENAEEVEDGPSAIIIIQAAVRGFLARRKLLKHKKAVKLQAAVRGHLVRRQAMGSLRCVQAIVKMQVLVRARQSMQHSSSISDKAEQSSKADVSSSSVEKLLQNKFARQLMESALKTKPINIKCDPTKPSSAWNWLERWMFVSSPVKTSGPDLSVEQHHSEKTEIIIPCPDERPSHDHLEATHSKIEIETEKNLSSDDASKIEVDHVEISEAEEAGDFAAVEAFRAGEAGFLAEDNESVNEQPKNSLKRKASCPSFIAAQSKFEELSSSMGSNKAVVLSYKDVVLGESKTDRSSPEANDAETREELSNTEDVARAQLDGGFECVNELSVPLTPEKPSESSVTEAAESNTEAKLFEKGTLETDEAAEVTNIKVEDLAENKLVEVEDEAVDSVVSETREKPDMSTPDAKKKKKKHEEPFSPEAASPMTIPESQATPASQVSSVKAKKDKAQKGGSSQKRSKKMASSSPSHECGGGAEQEAGKDHKSGRRRNSFGFDQEPRDSSGGKSSIPRFMQPTESARAKVQEHNSPRSSPDVHERDTSLKKRHSLPGAGANGKQSTSPRIQRSTSQATKERKWQR